MSLKIKRRRYNPAGLLQATAVFFASFSLAFTAGSLSFIPHDSSADTYVGDDLAPAIALSIDLADLRLPDSDTFSINEFVETTDDIDIIVSTNNPNGFALTMSPAGSTTGLTHVGGVTTIPSTSNLSPDSLDVNTWGYNVGSGATTFRRVPGLGSQTTLTKTNLPAAASTTTVTVGAKADTTIPSGSYTSTLRFTAVSN